MLGQSIPGTKAVDLVPTFSTENEASNAEVDMHVFKGDAKLVAYIASTSDQTSSHSFDFSKLLADDCAISMMRLGVVAGQNPSFHQSTPNVSSMDPDQALSGRTLHIALEPYEIIEVIFDAPTFSAKLTTMAELGLSNVPMPEDVPYGSDLADEDVATADDGSYSTGPAGILVMLPNLLMF